MNFVVCHSGFEAHTTEGPYTRATANIGVNGARLYKIKPITCPCDFTRRELETLRRTLPGRTRTLGPTTRAEAERFREHHREEVATTG